MEIKRVFDLLQNYVEKYPNQQVALAGKKNGQWVNYSSQSYKELSDTLSYALANMLPSPFSTMLNWKAKVCNNQITNEAMKMTVKARCRKSLVLSHNRCATFLRLGRR